MKLFTVITLIISATLLSCHNSYEKYYLDLKANYKLFDSVNYSLVNKYVTSGIFQSGKDKILLEIFPSDKNLIGGNSRIYDSSIFPICKKFRINSIRFEIINVDSTVINCIYSVVDNNVNYIYNSKGIEDNRDLNNDKAVYRRVSNEWQFLYEKPNF